MYCIFNCGVGMILCVDVDKVDSILFLLCKFGEYIWKIGCIEVGLDEIL